MSGDIFGGHSLGLLLAPGGLRPGTLLNTLTTQQMGPLPEEDPAQTPRVPRLRGLVPVQAPNS